MEVFSFTWRYYTSRIVPHILPQKILDRKDRWISRKENTIEIKETLAQNENNEDFFIHAVGTTDALTSSVLKSIKESSNSSLSLEELREKYGYFLFALDRKK